MPRLFIAIDLPDFVKDQLAEIQRFPVPGARRVQRQQMHLTLHFIGEVDKDVMNQIQQAMISFRHDPFEMVLEGVGYFPPRGKPRVLWAGIPENAALLTLHQTTGAALADIGLPSDDKAYQPHITLSRLRITPPRKAIQEFTEKFKDFRTVPFRIETFILYSSVLSSKGPRYTQEAVFPLR